MKRRDFLRLSALGGAAVPLGGCGKRAATQLIRFIPKENLIPGIAVWKPGVCNQCAAGCGLQVRIMEGNAEVVENGQLGIMLMGLAKKLEGSPQHPVNQGKLCVRGQAGLQVTYNPDRIQQPLKRVGARGSAQFAPISWDEALQTLATQLRPLAVAPAAAGLAFLTAPLHGQRGVLIERFLSAFPGAQLVPFELFDDNVLRRANALSFGYDQLPSFDLAHANWVISFGADFLGTWNSPVAQSLGYGAMRQSRSGVRGKFVAVEPRTSQTGANADEWIPAHPGTEGTLALGFAHVILAEHLGNAAAAGTAGARLAGWDQGLPDYTPEAVAWQTGVPPATITRLAREMATTSPALALVGGAPLAHTNGLFTALAVNALNALLGSVGKPGGLYFTPPLPAAFPQPGGSPAAGAAPVVALAQRILAGQSPRLLLLDQVNPVFATPPLWRVRHALEQIPFIASFSNFLDETTSLADLILPDHSSLESWVAEIPESGTAEAVVSLAPPAVLPLHNTRAMPDVLLALAQRLGGRSAAALPWKSFDAMLQADLAPLRSHASSVAATSADDFWKNVTAQGGWWAATPPAPPRLPANPGPPAQPQAPQFDGAATDFPFYFLPYASQQFFDGRFANLPWMQELPDVITTGMWTCWVEINPQTAAKLQIAQGDLLEVASQHGTLRAPAVIVPGLAPDVLAMPVGQGHDQYGRYAQGRGVNPLQILAPQVEPATGSLAWGATRVKLTRVRAGQGELILYSGGPTELSKQRFSR